MVTATKGSGTAWTPTRTRSRSTICGRAARRHGRCGSETRQPGRARPTATVVRPRPGASVADSAPVATSAIVTGARGFVGAWLAKGLLEQGAAVTSFDRRPRSGRPSILAMLGVDGD